jgi:hypothetical protein
VTSDPVTHKPNNNNNNNNNKNATRMINNVQVRVLPTLPFLMRNLMVGIRF